MKFRRWAFLKELVLLLLCLAALDYYVFGGQMFSWEPSPLWLPILLIPPRHGSIAGFVCGLASAVIYLWLLVEHGYSWQDLLHRTPFALIQPGLFLFFGVYLGAIGESQRRRIAFFQAKSQDLASQLNTNEIKRTELERSRIEMEKRIGGQANTLLTLQDNFKLLDGAVSEDELLFRIVTLLREESRAESCSIWRIAKGRATLVEGRHEGPAPGIIFDVRRKRRVVSAAEWSQHSDASPGADLAALISDNETERLVVAFVGVPFVRMNRELTLRVLMLAEHAGLILGLLRDKEQLRRLAAVDTESGLVSDTYLRRRVEEEVALARRHKTQLSLLACAVRCPNKTVQGRLETVLSSSIRAAIRFSDGLAYFPEERAFVIVLPQCDAIGADVVLRKIESNLNALALHDGQNRKIYKLAWAIFTQSENYRGEDIFASLFSGIRKEVGA